MSFPLLRRVTADDHSRVETPTKLNLFLELHGLRPDRFHELETLFLAIDRGDILHFETAGEDSLEVCGEQAPADRTNLVWRALERARESRPIPPLTMLLEKQIPAGTGLGGGSANAAGMLALLHDRFPDPRGASGVAADAAALGSDLNFFLGESAAAIGRGRGEQLEPLDAPLFGGGEPGFLILAPKLPSSTAEAFRQVSYPLTSPNGPITFPARTFEDLGEWQRGLFNRLEASVFRSIPPLADLAQRLSAWHLREWNRAGGDPDPVNAPAGATGDPQRSVWMTGSGSALFMVEENLTRAIELERAMTAPGGPIEQFSAESGVELRSWCANPLLPNSDDSIGGRARP